METQIKVLERVKMRSPVLIEGLPGIGNVGRVAAGYIISELKMKKIADMYSPHFLPLVILQQDGVAHPLRCEFYYTRVGGKDIVVLTGDTQSVTPEGHYDVCEKILDFAEQLGVKEIITLGGFSEGGEIVEPRVVGAVSDKKMLKKYGSLDIQFGQGHPVGTIVGASGLLLGMGKIRGIDGVCLMGETSGVPMITDPKAADKVLHILTKMLGIKVDMTRLEKTIIEMDERMKNTERIHKKILQDFSKQKGEDIKYIG